MASAQPEMGEVEKFRKRLDECSAEDLLCFHLFVHVISVNKETG
jgi:hypothetical protein